MTHAELIAALEAVTEGSEELDDEIAGAMGGMIDFYRPYTTSLDAALTLVPEGWLRGIVEWTPTGCVASLVQEQPKYRRVVMAAHTASLALCIAALKARLGP